MSANKVSLELAPASQEGQRLARTSSKQLLARARAASTADGPDVRDRCLGCKLLGFRGLVCLALSAAIGGLLVYADTQFTARPWYILLVAVLALCVPLKLVFLLWSSAGAKTEEGKDSGGTSNKYVQMLSSAMEKYFMVMDPDGKCYLSKTYASEMCRSGDLKNSAL